jgi:hypothetical protein
MTIIWHEQVIINGFQSVRLDEQDLGGVFGGADVNVVPQIGKSKGRQPIYRWKSQTGALYLQHPKTSPVKMNVSGEADNDNDENVETSNEYQSIYRRLALYSQDSEGVSDGDDAGNDENAGPGARARALSVWETRRLAEARARHKTTMTKKQVVWGREFKGAAFLPTPAEIVFRDFEVGRAYKQKVTLTNVSFTFNTFKVGELPDAVRDFFAVEYEFPGQVSAGMSCEVGVRTERRLIFSSGFLTPFCTAHEVRVASITMNIWVAAISNNDHLQTLC